MTELSPAWPSPAPGAAPLRKMVAAQASLELRTLVRNGEQLILTLIIPVLLLVAFSQRPILLNGTIAIVVIAHFVLISAFTLPSTPTGPPTAGVPYQPSRTPASLTPTAI